jgi:alpha-beta hydrolase superfamily lysophospholipase
MTRRTPRVAEALAIRALVAALVILAAGACEADEGNVAAERQGLRFERLRLSEAAPLDSYVARDGSALGLRIYPAESETSLIVIHGSGSESRYLAPLARSVAKLSVARVYTPDLRGHGPSPARRGDVDYVDQLEDDLADLVSWVRQRHPEDRVVIAGHSSGGGLALRFAGGKYGRSADGFALIAPYLSHDAPTMRPDAGGWAHPNVPLIVALEIANSFGVERWNDRIVIEFAMPESVRDGSQTLSYSYRLNTGYAPRDYARDLAAVREPLLVVVGSEDEAFYADRFGETIGAHARADVRLVEGASHLGIVSDPETARALAQWIAGLGTRR